MGVVVFKSPSFPCLQEEEEGGETLGNNCIGVGRRGKNWSSFLLSFLRPRIAAVVGGSPPPQSFLEVLSPLLPPHPTPGARES